MLKQVARDQEVNVTTQLNLGVRLLQAQAHKSVKVYFINFPQLSLNHDGHLHFCHTSWF